LYLLPEFQGGGALAYNGVLSAHNKLLLKFSAWIAVLKTLGAWGALLLAVIDSSSIPMPIDAVVAGYAYASPHRAWLYCLVAAIGSALGSLVPYALGRAGGEFFLLKRIDHARLQRIRDRFEKQEFLALMLPATLPPPAPFKIFVFSAGVFEMRMQWFLLAIVAGRVVRFGTLSALAVWFGPQIVSQAKNLVGHHLGVTVLVVLGAIGAGYIIFRLVRAPVAEVAWEIEHPEEKKTGDDAGTS
jgi:membrane protein YqaA with SNARE-associated domain